MIKLIALAAKAVGIKMLVTNSDSNLETQLNSLTRIGDEPIMLIGWDIDTDLEFNVNGTLRNPKSKIIALLVTKAYDNSKDEYEKAAVKMGELFQLFIQDLYPRLIEVSTESVIPISNCTYKLVPKYGAGKHSGVLASWSMISELAKCTPRT
jgi:hypothetical protein